MLFRVPRGDVPKVLSKVLAERRVVDVAVEDPPLEEIIAELFAQANEASADQVSGDAAAVSSGAS